MGEEVFKTYHLPDWDRAEKGTTLTDYALCGKYVRGEDQWFALSFGVLNCEDCIKIHKEKSNGC